MAVRWWMPWRFNMAGVLMVAEATCRPGWVGADAEIGGHCRLYSACRRQRPLARPQDPIGRAGKQSLPPPSFTSLPACGPHARFPGTVLPIQPAIYLRKTEPLEPRSL